MSFTPNDVITEVREQVQDADPTAYRYSDAFLVRKTNQALKRLAVVRPDLFSIITVFPLAAGSFQSAPTDSFRIMDIMASTDNRQMKEINQDTLDLMFPQWPNLAPSTPTNWMRYVRDPNKFYVYPPASAADQVTLMYAKSPPTYAQTDTIALNDVYLPIIVDCVIWLVESIDAEHVENGRAKMFQDAYKAGYTESLQARRITDSNTAGEDPKEII